MATIADDFLHKFRTIQGTTLAERKKNFYKLLHENADLKNNPVALDSISVNLQPCSYQETLFRLDFLIYFKRTKELLEVLRTGDNVFISKIAKQIWFFKDAFNDTSPEELVEEILPSMSFIVRMKILRKLSRYMETAKFEIVYDRISARYGVFLASQFITGCGPAKIRNILRDYDLELTSTQLRILYEKDPELVAFYFIELGNQVFNYKHQTFTKFLFNKNRYLYDRLAARHHIQIRLGRRTTKKLVVEKKEEVIKTPSKFVGFINVPAMYRKLGKDSVQLFINALPGNVKPCINTTLLFSGIPRKYHYSFFITIFQKHYNIKLQDHPSLVNDYLLRIIPTKSERALLAKTRVNQGRDDYLKYLLPEEAIQIIKDKINVTSGISERQTLIKYLVETCYENDDLDSLLVVMKYFCHRHKNEDVSTHLVFINTIERLFGYKRFTDEMWNCLNELMTIYTLKFNKDETTYQKIQTLPLACFSKGTSDEQKLRYLEYLFKKGKSIDDLITEYVSTHGVFPSYRNFDRDFGKHFFLHSINKLAKNGTESKDINFNYNLIKEIDNWNGVNSEKLSFYDFPNLLKTFNHIIHNVHYYHQYYKVNQHFRAKIFTTENNAQREEYLQAYWKRGEANLKDIGWFLKYDPTIVIAQLDTIVKILTNSQTNTTFLRMLHFIKKYSHLKLDTMATQNCLQKLHDESYLEMKPKLVPCLSVLMEPKDFASLADSFKPEKKKLDLSNEKEVRLYNLQIAIAAAFKNTRSYQLLPSLLRYCGGDYFKYALPSLYSLLYHAPENELTKHLDFISKKAVSVRKHALFLTCELGTLPAVEKTLQLLNQQEDVQSLQKHMFSATIKYFVKNPLDSFFQLVKMNMQFIGKADDESMNEFVDYLEKIPQKYKSEFIEAAWNHLEKTIDIWEKLAPLKNKLLQYVQGEVARTMSLEFGIKIIQQHFMTEQNLSISSFIFNLLCAKDEKEVIYTTIFNITDQCQEKQVFNFLGEWHAKIMTKNDDLSSFQPFVDYYEKKATVVEHFHHYIRCFFLKLHIEHPFKGVFIPNVTERILTFFEDTTSKYGESTIQLFSRELETNLRYFLSTDMTKNDFYYEIIKQRSSAAVAMLLLYVISRPNGESETLVFRKVLGLIEQVDNVGVQINLHCKFKDYFKTPKHESD